MRNWKLDAGLLTALPSGVSFGSGVHNFSSVVSKLKCPVFVASEVSGFVNLP